MTAARSNRLFWTLHSAGWTGAFLINYLSALAHGKPVDYWKITLPIVATGFVATLGLRYLLRFLAEMPLWRLVAFMVVPVLMASAAMGLVFVFALLDFCGDECRPNGTVGYFAYMAGSVYVITTWVGLYVVIKFHRRLREQTERALAATAMAHEAQLRMLRYQLNPHFVFNTLNAISTLNLDGDTATANRMVDGLSAFLRHSLDSDPMQRVTVAEEVAALERYLDIEKIRFAERLRVAIEIAPGCGAALVPGLLLQPLVENAIKHAISKNIAGGTLRIAARRAGERLLLAVADDGPGPVHPAGAAGNGRGVGLGNTRERLRVLYDGEQSVELHERAEGGCEVRLSLPFEVGRG